MAVCCGRCPPHQGHGSVDCCLEGCQSCSKWRWLGQHACEVSGRQGRGGSCVRTHASQAKLLHAQQSNSLGAAGARLPTDPAPHHAHLPLRLHTEVLPVQWEPSWCHSKDLCMHVDHNQQHMPWLPCVLNTAAWHAPRRSYVRAVTWRRGSVLLSCAAIDCTPKKNNTPDSARGHAVQHHKAQRASKSHALTWCACCSMHHEPANSVTRC